MKSIYIATPMFGGQCCGEYTRSLLEFTAELNRCGYIYTCNFIYNESLINRARNNLVSNFLASDCSHLLFIDADISFNAKEAVDILEYDLPVLAGIYPKKNINWDKIKESIDNKESSRVAINRGIEFVGNAMLSEDLILRDRSVSLKKFYYVGTGFLLIARDVFDKLIPKVERYRNYFDTGLELTYNFFNITVEPESRVLLSEDFYFSKLCRENSIPLYVVPWLELKHTGPYTYCLE